MATQVGVLDKGQLVQFGTPREIYEKPSSLYVASKLGLPRINTSPADLFSGAPQGAIKMGLGLSIYYKEKENWLQWLKLNI